ncbi:MAG: hypothetical protein WBF39_08230, partial [Planococcus donghaensis]
MGNKSSLIEAIAETLWNQNARELPEICESIGIDTTESTEDPMNSKKKYVRKLLLKKNVTEILIIANKVLNDYGDTEEGVLQKEINSQSGVYNSVEQLIFASIGQKPDITFDLVNNKLKIWNDETSLVYNKVIPSDKGLLLIDLNSWWELHKGSTDILKRMYDSIESPVEKIFYRAYYKKFLNLLGDNLPVLIPQVYFNYDPKTIKQLGGQRRVSQRMDFMMFLPNKRAIFEIDGVQHYSKKNDASENIAAPSIYAKMVAEDRE